MNFGRFGSVPLAGYFPCLGTSQPNFPFVFDSFEPPRFRLTFDVSEKAGQGRVRSKVCSKVGFWCRSSVFDLLWDYYFGPSLR